MSYASRTTQEHKTPESNKSDKGSAPGMRRTAIHLQGGIEPMKPQAHGGRRQPPTPLREEEGPLRGRHVAAPGLQRAQRRLEVGVQGNGATAGGPLTGAVRYVHH